MGDSTQKSTTEVKLPKWVEKGGQQNFQKAQQIAKRPYEAYGGERVAGMTDAQQAGMDTVQGATDAYATRGNQARDLLDQYTNSAASRVTAPGDAPTVSTTGIFDEGGPLGEFDRYMSPYTEQVLAPQIRALERAGAQARQGIDSQATMAGAFGDARHGVESGAQRRDELAAIGDVTGQAYQSAFDRAMASRGADANRFLQADSTNAQLLDQMLGREFQGELANAGFDEAAIERLFKGAEGMAGLDSQELQNLLKGGTTLAALGETERGVEQAGLDADYQGFLEERDWDRSTIDWLSSVLSMQPYPKSQTTTATTPSNPFGSVLGSLFGAFLK